MQRDGRARTDVGAGGLARLVIATMDGIQMQGLVDPDARTGNPLRVVPRRDVRGRSRVVSVSAAAHTRDAVRLLTRQYVQ